MTVVIRIVALNFGIYAFGILLSTIVLTLMNAQILLQDVYVFVLTSFAVSQGAGYTQLTSGQKQNFYTLFEHSAKLIVGLMLVLNGRKFANKLVRRDEKSPERKLEH